jgi:hypothetical protein
VYSSSYDYLTNAGVEVVRLVQRDAANNVLQSYVSGGGAIYNG